MSEWRGPWRCEKCKVHKAEDIGNDGRTHWRYGDSFEGLCDGRFILFDRRAPDPEKAELAEALRDALPVLELHRRDMGKLPRAGSCPTFYYTLSYEGDIKLLRTARRVHRQARALLKRHEKAQG